MKRYLILFILISIAFPVYGSKVSTLSRDGIPVYLNETPISFDYPPVLTDNRLIVPVREIAEALGGDVSWDSNSKTVKILADKADVSFIIGKNKMLLHNKEVEIDVAATIIFDRTFVPLRALSEAFGLDVVWKEDIKTAYLSKKTYSDYLISPTYYVSSEEFEGCVLACKTMVLSNHFGKPYTFAEVLEMNGGSVYTNWGQEFCAGVSLKIILPNESEIKRQAEDLTFSRYTAEEKFEMILSAVKGSSGIIAQFSDGEKSHGVVITGYTSDGELIVCDPDTKLDNPKNTVVADSCLANMFKLYTTNELLPYLVSMRIIES